MNILSIIGGELVARQLKKEGIDTVFGLIGGPVASIFAYLGDYGIKVIYTRHEGGAIHMADGLAQASRKAGVVVVSNGPGFSNAVAGIFKAYFARTPLLVITGGVVPQQKDIGGLQDYDQLEVVRPYTKWARVVYDTARIPEYISRGLQMAVTGRPGPVLLEMPINVLNQAVSDVPVYDYDLVSADVYLAGSEKVDELTELLAAAKKPVILAGDEVYYHDAAQELQEFAEVTRVPVFTVNKGRGCVPDTHPLCLGTGRIMDAGPNFAFQHADLIINIGIENDYQMGFFKSPGFGSGQRFVYLAKEAFSVLTGNFRPELVLLGNVDQVLAQICRRIREQKRTYDFADWVDQLKASHRAYWDKLRKEQQERKGPGVNPYECIRRIQKAISKDALIVIDGSNAMFWGALCFECNYPGQLIIGPDGQFGPMGTGVALALGAKAANPGREVVLYTGDGSFGFYAMEMDTAVRFNLPIMVFIHNDETWGFCKTTQEMLYGKTGAVDLGMVRYDKLTEALGGYGETITEIEALEGSIIRARESGLPACLNIMMDKTAYSPGVETLNLDVKKRMLNRK